ncbi:MAG: GNAT family N-acetyltransferase [Candidatus Izemoplasmatales bacterium]
MVRFVEEKDLLEVVDLVYKLNNSPAFYSGYCSKTKSKIKEEMMVLIKEKSALVYEDKNILGVLLYFKTPNNEIDVSGPFVENEDITIGHALLSRFFEDHQNVPVNFFFARKSKFYLKLMEIFNISFIDDEYILKLSRKDFLPIENRFLIRKARKTELSMVQDMHEEIFGDCYVTKDMLAEEDRFNQVYLLELDERISGFALLLIHETDAYLELFGLLKSYRGKGLSKSFLSKILEKAFEKDTIDHCLLVVDKINVTAHKIYRDLGFKIIEENVSYKRKQSM